MPIFITMTKSDFYVVGFKSLFDRFFSFVLLLGFLPFLTALTIFLWIDLRSNPVYFQKRPGKHGKIFVLLKFKTMKIEETEGSTTRFSRFLRSTSIDELLQLINILKGEMSFVGPRPLLLEYMPYYNEYESKRHDVMPGITGWAQVNGRNNIDWAKRMDLDIYYVENISLGLDLKIIGMTFLHLLKRDNTVYLKERTIKFSEYASKR